MLVAFVPIEPTRVGDFPEGRLLPERCELALFYRLFKDFALICRQHCRRRLFSLFLVFWPFSLLLLSLLSRWCFTRYDALAHHRACCSEILSLSLSSLLPSFFRALSNHHKRRRENDADSLSFLSLSLSRRRRRFAKERCWSVWFRTDLRSPPLSLCYPKLCHLKQMGVEEILSSSSTSLRPRRAEADRKSPEKDDDDDDDDDDDAKNDSRGEAFALLLPPATSRGGGVPPSVFFFVVVATRNASH